MPNSNENAVQTHLRDLRKHVEKGKSVPEQQLIFDPSTGQLALARTESRPLDPDTVVADQIAEEGFFS